MTLAAACGGAGESAPPPSERSTDPAGAPWFVEVAAESGLEFVHVAYHVQRYWMPEISPGGLALGDFDGDGWLDVYCVQSGDIQPDAARPSEPNRLFRNLGDGTFEDVTESAGVGDRGYGHGCTTGDYDGDGDLDLYVTNLAGNVLYRNEGGMRFRDVTAEAGVADGSWSTACAFSDLDGDADLDLFVVHNLNWSPQIEIEYCSPKNYGAPSTDALYRNEGDGSFLDVSERAGIRKADGIGLGVACADFDSDGDCDVYVANDSVPNVLWVNDGQGRFTNEALLLGCAVDGHGASEASMGIQAFDIEEDGDWDLFMTHVRDETNTFYRNTGGRFDDRTEATGLASASRHFTGFGMGFHDFDHDGRLDLFVANGRVDLWRPYLRPDRPYAEPNQLFRGLGGARFEEITPLLCQPQLLGVSRAAAFGDYDNDGDVDVLYLDLHEPLRLLRNDAPKVGAWIGFRVLDRRGSDALGATLSIETPSGRQHRLCHTSYSYCSANDPRVHFGLGPHDSASEVLVHWPNRGRERFGPHAAGSYHSLREGEGRPAPE